MNNNTTETQELLFFSTWGKKSKLTQKLKIISMQHKQTFEYNIKSSPDNSSAITGPQTVLTKIIY